ncbi:PCP reductase family protein [[Limnothrix rosea] IAM M-220]|uniref:PCP reductase family protein n=1 Tax=[Limnothrix rosea] IAM M-220 TaxID=454133 RepID=UPI00095FD73F|nr:PCP reductase family protein [[Limnothrix rosea] IAM M-220]OKH17795.1 protochlorophyllide oxidoreductase [[Limnothrix rosea] IAM M-220]
MEWTDDAKTLFKKIPFFVRPFAKKKIEKLAQEMGATVIDEEIYVQAKAKFNDPKKSGELK